MTRVDDDLVGELTALGAAMMLAQRVEFLLYGLVAHVNPDLRRHDKRFRDLTPEEFLRGDPSELKATFGQLAKEFGSRFLLSTELLDSFTRDRNLIVHNYWRLTKSGITGGSKLDDPLEFLREFGAKCEKLEDILKGIIVAFKLELGSKEQLTHRDTQQLAAYLQNTMIV